MGQQLFNLDKFNDHSIHWTDINQLDNLIHANTWRKSVSVELIYRVAKNIFLTGFIMIAVLDLKFVVKIIKIGIIIIIIISRNSRTACPTVTSIKNKIDMTCLQTNENAPLTNLCGAYIECCTEDSTGCLHSSHTHNKAYKQESHTHDKQQTPLHLP